MQFRCSWRSPPAVCVANNGERPELSRQPATSPVPRHLDCRPIASKTSPAKFQSWAEPTVQRRIAAPRRTSPPASTFPVCSKHVHATTQPGVTTTSSTSPPASVRTAKRQPRIGEPIINSPTTSGAHCTRLSNFGAAGARGGASRGKEACSEAEIRRFFCGGPTPSGCHLVRKPRNFGGNEAFALFPSKAEAERAVKWHKAQRGRRGGRWAKCKVKLQEREGFRFTLGM